MLFPNLVSRPRAAHLDAGRIFEAMKQDKKRVGEGLALVMLKEDHDLTKVVDFGYDELSAAVKELGEVIRETR